MIGPPLGGFIILAFSWRWIFLINVPIGILGIVLASIYIENLKEDEGAALFVLARILYY